MNKKLQVVLVALSITTTSFFCKTTHTNRGIASSTDNSCCIDTFKLKYQIVLGGGKVKKIDDNIYVGILKDILLVENRAYKKLVFGDSVSSVIALVRQDAGGLNYIGVSDKDTTEEKVLLYFAKKINDKWKVHIDDSYFWRKEITFVGMELFENEEVYVYTVETDKDYTSLGNDISKIYYSKEKGFLKFVFKTHWVTVEVNKLKSKIQKPREGLLYFLVCQACISAIG